MSKRRTAHARDCEPRIINRHAAQTKSWEGQTINRQGRQERAKKVSKTENEQKRP